MQNHLISKLTRYILYLIALTEVFQLYIFIAYLNLMTNYFEKYAYSYDQYLIKAEKIEHITEIHALLGIAIFLSSFFIIGRFFYISAKLNHLTGIMNLRISPGWAVGWYFIPIANIWKPYQSLKETFRASHRVEDWRSIKIPVIFPIWWATWLLGTIWEQYLIKKTEWLYAAESYVYTELITLQTYEILSSIIMITNAYCLLKITNIISQNQFDLDFSKQINPNNLL